WASPCSVPEIIVQRVGRVEGALCFHHCIQLRRAWKAAGRLLGELERAVDGDLEHAAVAFDQFDLGASVFLQPRRRLLRARAIAAGFAEFDGDFHDCLRRAQALSSYCASLTFSIQSTGPLPDGREPLRLMSIAILRATFSDKA